MAGARILVIGATGGSGRHVVAALCATGHEVVGLGRDAGRLRQLDRRAAAHRLDVADRAGLASRIADAEVVIGLVPPWHVADVLAAAAGSRASFIVGNSIRRYSQLRDFRAESARAAAAAFSAWDGRGVMLNFSMIYGHPEDANVNGMIRPLARWPAALPIIVPLPDGGRAQLQPVFIDDMVAAVLRAVERPALSGQSIDIAGGEVVSYAALLRHCASLVGRRITIANIPSAPLIGLIRGAARLGLRLPVTDEQLLRATESKLTDTQPQRELLGLEAIGIAEGFRRKRERGWIPSSR